MCPLGTPIYGMQRKCTTHAAFKSSLPLPSRWPSSSTSPTSSSAWCGGGAWTLTTSPSPTWRPLGTCWAPAFLPCASAASRCSRAWVSESRSPPNQPLIASQLSRFAPFPTFAPRCFQSDSDELGYGRHCSGSYGGSLLQIQTFTEMRRQHLPIRPGEGFAAQTAPSSWVSFQQCVQSIINLIFGIIPLYQFDRFLLWRTNWIWDLISSSLSSSLLIHERNV